MPVLAMPCAPATYPVQRDHEKLQARPHAPSTLKPSLQPLRLIWHDDASPPHKAKVVRVAESRIDLMPPPTLPSGERRRTSSSRRVF